MQHSALEGGNSRKSRGKSECGDGKTDPHTTDLMIDSICLAAERWQQNENVRSAVK